jgi:predicted ribosome quality control (RQC) complex YloA/Tae2 family protein
LNYYELKYLKEFIKSKILGKKIVLANTRYKNLIEFFIEGKDEDHHKLVFSTSPGNMALFLDYYSNPKKKNTISFFEQIYDQKINNIELAETDRIITLSLEGSYALVFKIFSNNGNVMLLKDGELIDSFKGSEIEDINVPEEKEIDLFDKLNEKGSAKQKLTSLNPLIPRNNLADIIKEHQVENMDGEETLVFIKKLTQEVENQAEWRLLENGNTALFSEEILPIKTEKHFDSINDLVAYRYKNYSHDQRLRQLKGDLLKQIKRQLKRVSSGLRNLDKADKGLERAEKYEKFGHLLMANGHLKPKDPSKMIVNDLYDEGKEMEIPLDEKFSIIQNAEKYYSKSKNSVRSYEEAIERIPVLEKRKEQLEILRDEIQDFSKLYKLKDWKKEKSKELMDLGIGENEEKKDLLPFHILEVENYTIWIGKNAKSNDKLVQMAHKEDVWLHARKVAGSHALIRMGNDKGMPPKNIILEAASYAAFNSKAKGAEVVPVIVTKKKYVRKPKGAPAGAVLVDKEEVEFVTPKKPDQ